MTVQGLTDEQARLTPTVSALSLGGLVKHVTATVDAVARLRRARAAGAATGSTGRTRTRRSSRRSRTGSGCCPSETLEGAIADVGRGGRAHRRPRARRVDLDETHPLPEAPWFPPDEAWSNRRVFMHVLAEIAQHAGHADILRESIDGQKTMG